MSLILIEGPHARRPIIHSGLLMAAERPSDLLILERSLNRRTFPAAELTPILGAALAAGSEVKMIRPFEGQKQAPGISLHCCCEMCASGRCGHDASPRSPYWKGAC